MSAAKLVLFTGLAVGMASISGARFGEGDYARSAIDALMAIGWAVAAYNAGTRKAGE